MVERLEVKILSGEAKVLEKIGLRKAPQSSIETPYRKAIQSNTAEALHVYQQVKEGATLSAPVLWAQATHKKRNSELQRILLRKDLDKVLEFQKNVMAPDFIAAGTVKPGAEFITRAAPGVGSNLGGSIEVVVKPGDVTLKSFSVIE